MTENPGQLVAGQYRLVAEIGRGGFGVVWRARHERLGRDVAAKKLFLATHAGTLGADQWQERSRRTFREARSAARIVHPAAVRIYDVVEHEGDPWIIMELVDGRSLNAVVRSQGPLPPRRVAEIGLRIVGALSAAHQAGVVHRDVNPANVLISGRGAVLTDFGIAVIQGDPSLTHTGVVMGAPAYTSPERARGEQAVPASDLWSLGATLYYAVEGGRPFPGPNANAVLYSILTTDPPVPRLAGPLTPVLNGLLHRDTAQRLTAAETAATLEGLLRDEGVWAAADATTIRTGAEQSAERTDPLPGEARAPRRYALHLGNGAGGGSARRPALTTSARRRTLALSIVSAVVLALLVGLSQRNGAAPDPRDRQGAASAAANAPRLIGTLTGDRVRSVAFSHDGSMLATGGDGTAVRLWDVAGRRQTGALHGQQHTVFSTAFSPDDRTLAAGGYDGRVILWNTTTRRRKSGFGMVGNSVGSLAFSPDGKILACAGSDAVRLWSTADRSWASTLRSPAAYESVFTTAFSRQGQLAVAGSATIRLWNSGMGEGRKAKSVTLAKVDAVVSSLAFSRDGGTLAAGGFDGKVRLYDTIRRRPRATLTGHDKSITAVAFHPRTRALASAGGETVRLWDTTTGRSTAVLRQGRAVVNALAFSPDGRVLATGDDDGAVRLYEIRP
ncbi:WD40 repeat domain-containing serine/threonine protein kinase [Spirillospora sp. NPDC048911]|uniref:WD40 repeat domain-containing serine/threonine protein kinase n=1 Tax=Spirillospora sp. NPDC048911 TaxID=3364527 RepID=UPI00371DB788